MSVRRNHNYRIGTDTLADGRIRATARGRKRNVKTFPAGTSHESAALTLATTIEGERIARVENLIDLMSVGKADWAIFVSTETGVK